MKHKNRHLGSISVRLAGDSGDGVQLMGSQIVASSAHEGNSFATFPDYPAEIRAPVGTTYGVSAFQINIGKDQVTTAGDHPDVLVAFNPAALKVSLPLIRKGALVVLNSATFDQRHFTKAGYEQDPRTTGELDAYQLVEVDISHLTLEAVAPFGLHKSDASRCKNLWALGLLLWMFDRDTDVIELWIDNKFTRDKAIKDSNLAALRAGHIYGEAAELSGFTNQYHIAPAHFKPGEYRSITGAEALALGLAAAAELADKSMLFCGYPITPASSLLHYLSRMKEAGIGTFQAEDEIAAICAAIGGTYAGSIGVTSSSGPGIALKTEAIGLAVNIELPLVIINSQRGGPSTGLPTKTEQSDLYQAVYGRNADTPLPVIAAKSPGDCFYAAIEAVRIALRHMSPVILLTDGYLSNAAEPWKIPDVNEMEAISVTAPSEADSELDSQAAAFQRNPVTQARPWIIPGMQNRMHRIGGIEKDINTAHISYDGENHQAMTNMRAAKVASVANFIPEQTLELGEDQGDLIVVGWGSTYGPIYQAVKRIQTQHSSVSYAHIRHINPLPANLGELLNGFKKILVPEMNMGQLATLLRDKLLVNPVSLCKVYGHPILISELEQKILELLDVASPSDQSPETTSNIQ